ncbi:hypothetical protein ACOSQ3_019300 [Xanthoceras sorbifolium]
MELHPWRSLNEAVTGERGSRGRSSLPQSSWVGRASPTTGDASPLVNRAAPPGSPFLFSEREGSHCDGEGSTSRLPHSLNGKGQSMDLSPWMELHPGRDLPG